MWRCRSPSRRRPPHRRRPGGGAFRSALAARWRELRADGLPGRLRASVRAHARLLVTSGAAGRNFRRWPVLGRHVWPNAPGARTRTTYRSEVTFLMRWLNRRLEWMDSRLGRR